VGTIGDGDVRHEVAHGETANNAIWTICENQTPENLPVSAVAGAVAVAATYTDHSIAAAKAAETLTGVRQIRERQAGLGPPFSAWRVQSTADLQERAT
jgi:hypothetical protein